MTSAKDLKLKQISNFKTSDIPVYLRAIMNQGGEVYEVGGPVRDRLLERPSKDHDLLVRSLSFDEIRSILTHYGAVILVGKAFGVLKFKPRECPDIEYDIALPRTEKSTGLGHRDFEVSYDPDLPVEADLKRRDFTINAMAFDYKTGALIDPFDGCGDLSRKILRQVHDESFPEDPLRLLRAVQFTARLHLKIEAKTLRAMQEHAALIQTVSAERITMEIGKLLQAPKPSICFCIMRDTGLLSYVFPELQKTVGVEQGRKLKNDDVFMHSMRVMDAARVDEAIPNAGDMELMIAALFHDIGKPPTKRFDKTKQHVTFYGHQLISKRMAKKRINALKMTTLGITPKNVETLIENHMFQAKSFFSEKAIRRFIRSVGEDLILKLVDLRIADNRGGKYPEGIRGVQRLRDRIAKELDKEPVLSVQDLAINGHDLMKQGIAAGPEMGHILRNLLEVIIDDPSKNEKDTLVSIVRDTLGYGQTKKHEKTRSDKTNSET